MKIVARTSIFHKVFIRPFPVSQNINLTVFRTKLKLCYNRIVSLVCNPTQRQKSQTFRLTLLRQRLAAHTRAIFSLKHLASQQEYGTGRNYCLPEFETFDERSCSSIWTAHFWISDLDVRDARRLAAIIGRLPQKRRMAGEKHCVRLLLIGRALVALLIRQNRGNASSLNQSFILTE
jgi:hypothetical protein